MELRKLGKSELQVSAIGLGCNNFGMLTDFNASRAVIHAALDLGITLFDTADIYGNRGGSETILGKVLGHRRKDIILATKVGRPMDDDGKKKGASRDYILSEVDTSLRRLQTDWIDLYQIHEFDPQTSLEETLNALNELIRQGKVREIGCSNFPAERVDEACCISNDLKMNGFITCQDQYSLLDRSIESELMPAMKQHGLGLLPYFPLAGGMLTGKYKRREPPVPGTRFASWKPLAEKFLTDKNWDAVERLDRFCGERQYSLLELSFNWLLANPAVSSVIAGATQPDQLRSNVASLSWKLPPEDLEEIDYLLKEK
jgi:aryl-alcohol dehydrogenase-like predicted oxidoreductase